MLERFIEGECWSEVGELKGDDGGEVMRLEGGKAEYRVSSIEHVSINAKLVLNCCQYLAIPYNLHGIR